MLIFSTSDVFIVLYRVRRNLQHFQANVNFVTHIKEWEVEKEAWREERDIRCHPGLRSRKRCLLEMTGNSKWTLS